MEPASRRQLIFSHFSPPPERILVIGPNEWSRAGISVPDSFIPPFLEEKQRVYGGTAVFIPPNISIKYLMETIGQGVFVDESSASFAWHQYSTVESQAHWVLFNTDNLPRSLGKSFGQQMHLAGEHGGGHVTSGIDLTIYLILMNFLGQPINWDDSVWFRCPEEVNVEGTPELLIVGGIRNGRLDFTSCDHNPQDNVGVITAFTAY